MADYIFFNNNPEKLIENDCVTRSISLASGLPYEAIEEKLYLIDHHYTDIILNL